MTQNKLYKPVRFFLITFAITWISWFLAAYFSYQENGESIFVPFMIPGLVAPFLTALILILISGSKEMKKEFKAKLFDLRRINLRSLPAMFLLMPIVVVVSTLISITFGGSVSQLLFAEEFSFTAGMIPVLLILVLAASFEELGWRSYAMDSLSQNFNYFKSTLIFGLLWAAWHLPLFFIKDYYQNEIIRQNVLYGINFFVSVIPMAFIISWLCKLNKGNILIAILYHLSVNLTQEALQITQVTKCIETIVLVLVAAFIVYKNREMFFGKTEKAENTSPNLLAAAE